jgi:hydroxymethylbilane synthase
MTTTGRPKGEYRSAQHEGIPMTTPTLIATRESRLALWQAEHVRGVLVARFGMAVELLGMTTRGDQILDRALSKVGGKGLFVKELEAALEQGRAQLAVHSLKDVPMDLPPGFAIAAVWQREDARDAFVSSRFAGLTDLPQGAVVGTSSLRRVVQLLALRPDLRIEPLRGNLDTRLRKLDEGGFDAIVLAAAGLKRLGMASRIRACFEPAQMLPAVGQGALALEVREDASALRALLAQTSHGPTALAVQAERAVARELGGSCSMPLAAHAVWAEGHLHLEAALGDALDAYRPLLRARASASVASEVEACALGSNVVAQLHAAGAAGYLPPSAAGSTAT